MTFDTLKDVYKIIDQRLEILRKTETAASLMIEGVLAYIREEASMRYNGQIQMYSIRHIKELTESFDKESSFKIEEKINNYIAQEKVRLSVLNIFILFTEIV